MMKFGSISLGPRVQHQGAVDCCDGIAEPVQASICTGLVCTNVNWLPEISGQLACVGKYICAGAYKFLRCMGTVAAPGQVLALKHSADQS